MVLFVTYHGSFGSGQTSAVTAEAPSFIYGVDYEIQKERTVQEIAS